MTYKEKVTEIIDEVFPYADSEEIIDRTCPHHFLEGAVDYCGIGRNCESCWGKEIEEDD